MKDLQISGNESGLSVIQDPFKKSMVTCLFVHAQKQTWNNKWLFSGTLKFQNGNTKGEQEFEGSNFDEVVLKIKAMIDTLE